jgi:hypothetical protein
LNGGPIPPPFGWTKGFPTETAKGPDAFKLRTHRDPRAEVAEWLMRRTADPFPGGSIPSLGLRFGSRRAEGPSASEGVDDKPGHEPDHDSQIDQLVATDRELPGR